MTPLFFTAARIKRSFVHALGLSSVLTLGLIMGPMAGNRVFGSPALAAETVTVRLGRFAQTVALADLERFVATGEVPSSLGLYRPLLTPSLREALGSQIALEPEVSHVILDEIFTTPGGSKLQETLQAVAPNLTPEDLKATIDEASKSADGLNLLGLLRAMPQDTLEINVGTLITLGSQFRLAQLESEALSRVLRKELEDEDLVDIPPLEGVDPFTEGEAQVERWELLLRDRKRDRNIPVDIYWSHDTRGPLVVISHGFGADRRFFAYLAKHLASHGLTVVAVEHPGSNVAALMSLPVMDAPDDAKLNRILPATEFLDRPKDISFVLDRLEKLNLYSYTLRRRINTDQVTLIGHSLGGYTGLALAGAALDLRSLKSFCPDLRPVSFSPADWFQCAALDLPVQYANLRDERVTQLIVTNPLTGLLFGEAGLSQVQVPTLMLASTHDSVTPMAKQQLGPFMELGGPKYLMTVIGGSHLSVGDPNNLNADLHRIPFMPELPDSATAPLRDFLQGISLSFIMQQTAEAETYAPALSAHYAHLYSTDELSLRLTEDLPARLSHWPRLRQGAFYHQENLMAYGSSLLHLEALTIQDQFQAVQRQMIAYLRNSPPSLLALYSPRRFFYPHLQAQRPGDQRATP
jgi:predicted dienelactone hydrolase